jgi:DNA-binding response OmpR family regulator
MSQQAKSILIVDDEQDILLFLEAVLSDEGYRVLTASRGEELFALLERGLPDLILLDMLLSGTDGRAIIRRLKSQAATASVPVLLVSAHPRAEQEALDSGGDGFLAKPFDIDEVIEKVASYFS